MFDILVAAVRAKAVLFARMREAPATAWGDDLRVFLATLSALGPLESIVLITLLVDLLDEMSRLAGQGLSASLASAALREVLSPERPRDDILHQFELRVIACLARQASAQPPSHITRVLAFIEHHYHEPLTLDVLASVAHLERTYLATLFRRVTGSTFHAHLTRTRMQRAIILIRDGEKVAAVTELVGYKCKKNFYRHFRALTGTTPAAFRRREMRATARGSRGTAATDTP